MGKRSRGKNDIVAARLVRKPLSELAPTSASPA